MKAGWVEKLARSMDDLDKVPAEFLTTNQWAERIGKSRQHTQTLLSLATEKGLVEVREFRIKAGQVTRPVPHYKEI